jgi:hypothetical protein
MSSPPVDPVSPAIAVHSAASMGYASGIHLPDQCLEVTDSLVKYLILNLGFWILDWFSLRSEI